MRAGFVMNIVSVLILTLGVNTWGAAFFGLTTLPAAFRDPVNITTTHLLGDSSLGLANMTALLQNTTVT